MKISMKKDANGKWAVNAEAAERVLKEVEGKARERKLAVTELNEAVNAVDERLSALGVCRKNRSEIKIFVNSHAQKFANCYKGTPMSTQFVIEYTKAGTPVITKLYRGPCGTHYATFKLTDKAKQDILGNAEKCEMEEARE